MMTGDANDYSVCTTWRMIKADYYLVDVFRGRLQYPDLRRKVASFAAKHDAETILIENAGPGMALLQDLWRDLPRGMPRPIGQKPEGSKADRMVAQSAKIEAGHVHLPREADWLDTFLLELLAFPNGRHDDQVDSVSQFLNWSSLRGPFDSTMVGMGAESFCGRNSDQLNSCARSTRLVQLLVERVDVSKDGADIRLRTEGLHSARAHGTRLAGTHAIRCRPAPAGTETADLLGERPAVAIPRVRPRKDRAMIARRRRRPGFRQLDRLSSLQQQLVRARPAAVHASAVHVRDRRRSPQAHKSAPVRVVRMLEPAARASRGPRRPSGRAERADRVRLRGSDKKDHALGGMAGENANRAVSSGPRDGPPSAEPSWADLCLPAGTRGARLRGSGKMAGSVRPKPVQRIPNGRHDAPREDKVLLLKGIGGSFGASLMSRREPICRELHRARATARSPSTVSGYSPCLGCRPAGDGHSLAPCWVQSLLALEVEASPGKTDGAA